MPHIHTCVGMLQCVCAHTCVYMSSSYRQGLWSQIVLDWNPGSVLPALNLSVPQFSHPDNGTITALPP